MAVGSVSFGNSPAFNELINRQQTYQAQTPSAATNISGEKKSHKTAKIAVGVAAAVIATAIGLAYGATKGKFDFANLKNNKTIQDLYEKHNKPQKIKNIVKTILNGLDTAGKKLSKWGTNALDWAKNLLPKAEKAAQTAAEQVADTVQDVAS